MTWRARPESVSSGQLPAHAFVHLNITLALSPSQRPGFGQFLYQANSATGNLRVSDGPFDGILGDHSVSLYPSSESCAGCRGCSGTM